MTIFDTDNGNSLDGIHKPFQNLYDLDMDSVLYEFDSLIKTCFLNRQQPRKSIIQESKPLGKMLQDFLKILISPRERFYRRKNFKQ